VPRFTPSSLAQLSVPPFNRARQRDALFAALVLSFGALPVAAQTAADASTLAVATVTQSETMPAAVVISNGVVAAPLLPSTTSSVMLASESAPQSVPAQPVNEAPPADIWDRIRSGYAMEDLNDPLVAKWEKYYADRPDYMARIVERSSKYMFYIVTELERRGMPLEIALLPMIESAFNPIAHSSAKASGIWQFIPSTGVNYGMKQDWWSDNRRDIVQATNGAIDYLSKLNGMFGDWQLALASYNWGEGSVGRAVQKSKASGGSGNYLSLNMPAETRNYLPKLQAVKNIIRNPAAYGLTIATVPNEPYFKTITLAHAMDLKRAAQLAEMTEADFVALNPAHNRPVIGGRSEYQVLLPATKADDFLARLGSSEKPRVSWMAYRTRSGDRMEALAERFGTTVAALKSVNGIRAVAPTLPAGYHLLVPSDGPSEDALGSIQNAVFTKFPEYVAPRTHKVSRGENFASIAKRYGVKPATLAQWNRMGKPTARAGQVLYVSGPAPVRQMAGKGSKAGRVVYVKRGGKTVRTVVANKRGPVKKNVTRRR
jgi:membrane-bound lytic murein transglycosylase D